MSNEVVKPVTYIIDLPSDCLLALFRYLDLMELANLAEADITSGWQLGKHKRDREDKINRYKQSIVQAFKIKVRAHECKTYVHVDPRDAVKDIKMLRNFGTEIEALLIQYSDYGRGRRYEKAVEDAICNNCCETVVTIYFSGCNEDAMNELDRPFTNAELVQFHDDHLGATLVQLKKWFPKMDDLRLEDTYVFDAKCIHEHFPELKSLMVQNADLLTIKKGKMHFTNCDLKIFLLLNPQLDKLDICHDNVDESVNGHEAIIVDWDLLTFIGENLKLQTLVLNLKYFTFQKEWPSTVHLNDLNTLNVACPNFDCLAKIRVTSLKKMKISIESTMKQVNYKTLAEFVIRAEPQRLEIIAAFCGNALAYDNEHILRMTRMLPKLQELVIQCNWEVDIPDGVLNLLLSNTSLKTIKGIFFFDEGGDPGPQFLQMRDAFREKISRSEIANRIWTFRFEYKKDDDYYVDSIICQKKE